MTHVPLRIRQSWPSQAEVRREGGSFHGSPPDGGPSTPAGVRLSQALMRQVATSRRAHFACSAPHRPQIWLQWYLMNSPHTVALERNRMTSADSCSYKDALQAVESHNAERRHATQSCR